MLREAAAGVVGLGLIGGVGSVVYEDDGTTKVTITDKSGKEQTVSLDGSGPAFTCPPEANARIEEIDVESGRVKLTLQKVEEDLEAIEERYPKKSKPPARVVKRYRQLTKQHKGLVKAFNATIDEHNAVLEKECTKDE